MSERPMQVINFIKDDVELEFRTIRIGTLRTFPKDVNNVKEAMLFNETGFRFKVQLSSSGSGPYYDIEMPSEHITKIEAFTGRGCPVMWITPSKTLATEIRSKFGLDDPNGWYLDPNSKRDKAETRIAVVVAVDPIPFEETQSLKKIFNKIAQKINIHPDAFYVKMTHRECNDELVRCTLFMDKVEALEKKGKIKGVVPKHNQDDVKKPKIVKMSVKTTENGEKITTTVQDNDDEPSYNGDRTTAKVKSNGKRNIAKKPRGRKPKRAKVEDSSEEEEDEGEVKVDDDESDIDEDLSDSEDEEVVHSSVKASKTGNHKYGTRGAGKRKG